MKEIQYRKNEFYERSFKGQEFSEFEDELQLDEEKDEIVVVGKINIQERIQSSEDCALDKILDKYLDVLPDVKVEVDNDTVYEHSTPDLADLGAEYERVEQLKEKYNLDPALSYEQTLQALKDEKAKLDAYLLKASQGGDEEHETTQDEQEKK